MWLLFSSLRLFVFLVSYFKFLVLEDAGHVKDRETDSRCERVTEHEQKQEEEQKDVYDTEAPFNFNHT